MITYVSLDIWESPAQTLVNTINIVGVMGKGIALEFKQRYPEMFLKYKTLCEEKALDIGKLWLYKAEDRQILNFPTKRHWRNPSKAEYLIAGLEKFLLVYERLGITSISFPLLGTGNGGLDWESIVKPIMEKYLQNLPIPVYIHLRKRAKGFIPEHLLPISEAIPFDTLVDDIKKFSGMQMKDIIDASTFTFKGLIDDNLVFLHKDQEKRIPLEHLRMLWDDLHSLRLIQFNKAPGQIAENYNTVFALLSNIPYIKEVSAKQNPSELDEKLFNAIMLTKSKPLTKQDTSKGTQVQLALPL